MYQQQGDKDGSKKKKRKSKKFYQQKSTRKGKNSGNSRSKSGTANSRARGRRASGRKKSKKGRFLPGQAPSENENEIGNSLSVTGLLAKSDQQKKLDSNKFDLRAEGTPLGPQAAN